MPLSCVLFTLLQALLTVISKLWLSPHICSTCRLRRANHAAGVTLHPAKVVVAVVAVVAEVAAGMARMANSRFSRLQTRVFAVAYQAILAQTALNSQRTAPTATVTTEVTSARVDLVAPFATRFLRARSM